MGVDPVAADANTESKTSSDPTQTENQELPQVLHVWGKNMKNLMGTKNIWGTKQPCDRQYLLMQWTRSALMVAPVSYQRSPQVVSHQIGSNSNLTCLFKHENLQSRSKASGQHQSRFQVILSHKALEESIDEKLHEDPLLKWSVHLLNLSYWAVFTCYHFIFPVSF